MEIFRKEIVFAVNLLTTNQWEFSNPINMRKHARIALALELSPTIVLVYLHTESGWNRTILEQPEHGNQRATDGQTEWVIELLSRS